MRVVLLGMVLMLPIGPALAQSSHAVTPNTVPAPVPDVMPGAPAGAGPGATPQQLAPPALAAGPADATPFSAAPSAQLPPDSGVVLRRDGPASGQPSPVPNLSK